MWLWLESFQFPDQREEQDMDVSNSKTVTNVFKKIKLKAFINFYAQVFVIKNGLH